MHTLYSLQTAQGCQQLTPIFLFENPAVDEHFHFIYSLNTILFKFVFFSIFFFLLYLYAVKIVNRIQFETIFLPLTSPEIRDRERASSPFH